MAASEHLKDLKAVWGDSCHAMWVELLCIAMAESHVVADYKDISPGASIHDMFYVPELKGRINGLTRDTFLERSPGYRHAVIANRIVILSASFEAYFTSFLDAYIANRRKLSDSTTGKRTAEGDKLYGDIRKARGLEQRIAAGIRRRGDDAAALLLAGSERSASCRRSAQSSQSASGPTRRRIIARASGSDRTCLPGNSRHLVSIAQHK